MKEKYEYYLGESHWINANPEADDYKEAELVAAARNIIGGTGNSTNINVVSAPNSIHNINISTASTAMKSEQDIQPVSVSPLLKRGFLFLEDGEWDNANEYFEKVLDSNPECAEAYLGKLLLCRKLKTTAELKKYSGDISSDGHFIKALRFADDKLKAELDEYNKTALKQSISG